MWSKAKFFEDEAEKQGDNGDDLGVDLGVEKCVISLTHVDWLNLEQIKLRGGVWLNACNDEVWHDTLSNKERSALRKYHFASAIHNFNAFKKDLTIGGKGLELSDSYITEISAYLPFNFNFIFFVWHLKLI